ncbi:hypothetical protein B0H34DRAFT_721666 [Crassisporium funariophilum]|nr:hypothetical protein B0H34DRAFT_721666 [Crassisporium funariophilum]
MTRTARATYPRAVIKDRSESRTGLESGLRKSGAGHHNWGSLADEQQLESAALEDEDLDEETEIKGPAEDLTASTSSRSISPHNKPEIQRSTSGLSDDELENARKFRKNALKKTGEIDLTAIARTSAGASTSPPSADGLSRRTGQSKLEVTPADYKSAV